MPERPDIELYRAALRPRIVGKPIERIRLATIQRIVHGEHEVNYCPTCQTEGRLLADRALSTLLKDDWPRTLDELERRRQRSRSG